MEIDYSERVEVECVACDDSGWRTVACAGMHSIACNRTRKHLPHDFAVPCYCRPVNRVYQEKQGAYVRSI